MSAIDLISPQNDPSEQPIRPRRGDNFSTRLKEMMAQSDSLSRPIERPARKPLSGDEVVALARRYAATGSNGQVAERLAREDYERKRLASQEAETPKRRSREDLAAHLRSKLADLTPTQRVSWSVGEQFDGLSTRMQEIALDVLDEFDAEEAEPTEAWLTGLVLDDGDEETA